MLRSYACRGSPSRSRHAFSARMAIAPVSRHTDGVWNPWRRATGVVVRASGFTYASRRDVGGAWRCGRCNRHAIRYPDVGRRCAGCGAEVVAVQRGLDVWILLLVVVMLVGAWAALTWWR